MFVDSHCHLNRDEFGGDLEQVIQRAKAVGITKMLSICTNFEEAAAIIALSNQYPELFCSVGVHPHDAQAALENWDMLTELNKYCRAPKVVGLGETGLDFYYENSPRDLQIQAFDIHIALAEQLNLPLIVHSRNADDDTINCLQQKKGQISGVMHCFSGSNELAKASLDMGFYISISGIVTFKNANDLRAIIKYVPLDRLLVETDAPFLAPIPYRGKRNEPCYMIETIKKVAEVKSLSVEELGQVTTDNFHNLFPKARG